MVMLVRSVLGENDVRDVLACLHLERSPGEILIQVGGVHFEFEVDSSPDHIFRLVIKSLSMIFILLIVSCEALAI